MRIEDLAPRDAEVIAAHVRVSAYHEPRTPTIGHTIEHACMTCDEVWPCDIAIVLAGMRDLHQALKNSNTAFELLSKVTHMLIEMVEQSAVREALSPADRAKIIMRIRPMLEALEGDDS